MSRLYGLIDCARDPRLHRWVTASPQWACLFAGPLDRSMEVVLPYIVALTDNAPIWQAWRAIGWGQSWGLICSASADLPTVRRHFRRFLQVKLPDGDVVQFRFYDPRVWRTYLPSCTPAELAGWFDAVTDYRAETEAGDGTLFYALDGGALRTATLGPPYRPAGAA